MKKLLYNACYVVILFHLMPIESKSDKRIQQELAIERKAIEKMALTKSPQEIEQALADLERKAKELLGNRSVGRRFIDRIQKDKSEMVDIARQAEMKRGQSLPSRGQLPESQKANLVDQFQDIKNEFKTTQERLEREIGNAQPTRQDWERFKQDKKQLAQQAITTFEQKAGLILAQAPSEQKNSFEVEKTQTIQLFNEQIQRVLSAQKPQEGAQQGAVQPQPEVIDFRSAFNQAKAEFEGQLNEFIKKVQVDPVTPNLEEFAQAKNKQKDELVKEFEQKTDPFIAQHSDQQDKDKMRSERENTIGILQTKTQEALQARDKHKAAFDKMTQEYLQKIDELKQKIKTDPMQSGLEVFQEQIMKEEEQYVSKLFGRVNELLQETSQKNKKVFTERIQKLNNEYVDQLAEEFKQRKTDDELKRNQERDRRKEAFVAKAKKLTETALKAAQGIAQSPFKQVKEQSKQLRREWEALKQEYKDINLEDYPAFEKDIVTLEQAVIKKSREGETTVDYATDQTLAFIVQIEQVAQGIAQQRAVKVGLNPQNFFFQQIGDDLQDLLLLVQSIKVGTCPEKQILTNAARAYQSVIGALLNLMNHIKRSKTTLGLRIAYYCMRSIEHLTSAAKFKRLKKCDPTLKQALHQLEQYKQFEQQRGDALGVYRGDLNKQKTQARDIYNEIEKEAIAQRSGFDYSSSQMADFIKMAFDSVMKQTNSVFGEDKKQIQSIQAPIDSAQKLLTFFQRAGSSNAANTSLAFAIAVRLNQLLYYKNVYAQKMKSYFKTSNAILGCYASQGMRDRVFALYMRLMQLFQDLLEKQKTKQGQYKTIAMQSRDAIMMLGSEAQFSTWYDTDFAFEKAHPCQIRMTTGKNPKTQNYFSDQVNPLIAKAKQTYNDIMLVQVKPQAATFAKIKTQAPLAGLTDLSNAQTVSDAVETSYYVAKQLVQNFSTMPRHFVNEELWIYPSADNTQERIQKLDGMSRSIKQIESDTNLDQKTKAFIQKCLSLIERHKQKNQPEALLSDVKAAFELGQEVFYAELNNYLGIQKDNFLPEHYSPTKRGPGPKEGAIPVIKSEFFDARCAGRNRDAECSTANAFFDSTFTRLAYVLWVLLNVYKAEVYQNSSAGLTGRTYTYAKQGHDWKAYESLRAQFIVMESIARALLPLAAAKLGVYYNGKESVLNFKEWDKNSDLQKHFALKTGAHVKDPSLYTVDKLIDRLYDKQYSGSKGAKKTTYTLKQDSIMQGTKQNIIKGLDEQIRHYYQKNNIGALSFRAFIFKP